MSDEEHRTVTSVIIGAPTEDSLDPWYGKRPSVSEAGSKLCRHAAIASDPEEAEEAACPRAWPMCKSGQLLEQRRDSVQNDGCYLMPRLPTMPLIRIASQIPLLGAGRPHKQKHPAHHGFRNHPRLGP